MGPKRNDVTPAGILSRDALVSERQIDAEVKAIPAIAFLCTASTVAEPWKSAGPTLGPLYRPSALKTNFGISHL
jgi:hypothetical protein